MSILYKYCNQIGALKMLGALELKLPYISDVNDPVECFPCFYCGGDKSMIQDAKRLCLEKGLIPRVNLLEAPHIDNFQRMLENKHREQQKKWNSTNCLLSLSGTERNIVMWAHYADKHQGVVIGIDFDNLFALGDGVTMDRVIYSKKRPRVDLLLKDKEERLRQSCKVLITKSESWDYEDEHRNVILNETLEKLQKDNKASFRDFNGKGTWFLRLRPEAIKEIIFGLFADQGLKTTVRNLASDKMPDVKFFQVAISKDEYDFELKPVDGS